MVVVILVKKVWFVNKQLAGAVINSMLDGLTGGLTNNSTNVAVNPLEEQTLSILLLDHGVYLLNFILDRKTKQDWSIESFIHLEHQCCLIHSQVI